MKRSVAILGPTPSFIAWAIARDCPLRENQVDSPDELPAKAFRQLRAIRELGLGRIQSRVFEDICVHPDVMPMLDGAVDISDEHVAAARGFPSREIFAISGSVEMIAGACDQCPANALANAIDGPFDGPFESDDADDKSKNQSRAWAGCYGWTPVSIRRESVHSEAVAFEPPSEEGDLAILIEEVLQELDAENQAFYESEFLSTHPRWLGLWSRPVMNPVQAAWVAGVLKRASLLVDQSPNVLPVIQTGQTMVAGELETLIAALQSCERNELKMHVRLIPHGYSDGVKWELETHCPRCRARLDSEFEQPFHCDCCGDSGILNRVAKRKVLGNRPYLHLSRLLGPDATREFLKRYRDSTID